MNEKIFEKFPVLETNRMSLVRHHPDHAPAMYTLRTDPDVMKYMDAHPPKNVEDTLTKIASIRQDYDDKKGVNWIMWHKGTDAAIGYASLWRIDKLNNRGEIGYAILKNHWKKGLTKEAIIAVINYAFEYAELHTLIANTNLENEGSQALLKRLGFQLEAHFRQDYYFDGKYLDSYIYGLTKDDWKALQEKM